MVSLSNGVLTFLLLLFALHLRKGACKYENFNCQFDDKDYNLKTNYDVERVQFGDEPEGVIGNITTYFHKIKTIYTQFLAPGLMYNGVDNYIRFHKYYKTVRDNFEKEVYPMILRTYNVTIDSDEETAGNIITLMELIVSKEPSLAVASYLVTASPTSQNLLSTVNSPEDYDKWKYENLAGVIKIKDQSSRRVGYVLLDPKRFDQPVVVMEDGGKAPFKPYDHSKNALAQINCFAPYNPKNHNRIATNFIYGEDLAYYFKRPYCSFVEHTVKLHLVGLQRTLNKGFRDNPQFTTFVAESITGLSIGKFNAFFFISNINNATMLIPFPTGLRIEPEELEDLPARINCLCTYLGPKEDLDRCYQKMLSRLKDLREISNDERFIGDSSKYKEFLEQKTTKLYMNNRRRM